MQKKSYKLFLKYGAITFLLIFASIQFFLILRHKSPYVSDSYFYKHIYYQIKGDSFEKAKNKIISQVNLEKADETTKNIFSNTASYRNSYSFFTKRPFYSFAATVLSIFSVSEYFSFL